MSAIGHHLHSTLGIDIRNESVASKSDLDSLQAAMEAHAIHQTSSRRQNVATYLSAIYQGLVGLKDGEPMDKSMTEGDLRALMNKTGALYHMPETTPLQREVLSKAHFLAIEYRKFLNREVDLIPKDLEQSGTRHSVARAKGGHCYEMTNSMDLTDRAHTILSTGLVTSVTENPRYFVNPVNATTYAKIGLGGGTNSTVRIARDIESDVHVAVKKSHPRITIDRSGVIMAPPVPSQFYTLSSQRQAVLRRLDDAVITPIDHGQFNSAAGQKMRAQVMRMRDLQDQTGMREREALLAQSNVDHLPSPLRQQILDAVRNPAPIDPATLPQMSDYSFFELAVGTVGEVVEHLNQQRVYFEMLDADPLLRERAMNLLADYAIRFQPARATDREAKLAAAADWYARPDFKLKDPVYNQRFLNTLGKKMLQSLAVLHAHGFSHQDINPSNLVLSKDRHDNLAVKLIGLDLIENSASSTTQPYGGSDRFLPPEAASSTAGGSHRYTGEKSDDYAMGLCLRKLAGFGDEETYMMTRLQRLEAAEVFGVEPDEHPEIEQMIVAVNAFELDEENAVEVRTRVIAREQVAPQTLRLKDISDLLLSKPPAQRHNSTEALDIEFFKIPDNFLSESEFSAHAIHILRMGIFSVTDDREHFNDENNENGAPRTLAALRSHTDVEMREHVDRFVIARTRFHDRGDLEYGVAVQDAVLEAQATGECASEETGDLASNLGENDMTMAQYLAQCKELDEFDEFQEFYQHG
ncbi:MAG: hypothetical protein H7315_09945 [Herminiimonas sp.]|nr:hypothetical protein [Herminiimonas sp.]